MSVNEVLLENIHFCICHSCCMLRQHSGVAAMETTRLRKPKPYTICPFTEEVCGPLLQAAISKPLNIFCIVFTLKPLKTSISLLKRMKLRWSDFSILVRPQELVT